MEVTSLFKATVKALKARQKAQGGQQDKNKQQSQDILRIHRKSEFSSKAQELVQNITKLRLFLLEHRKSYISASSHLLSTSPGLTDAERDQIDTDAQTFIRTCQDAITTFKNTVAKDHVNTQVREHRDIVISLIEEYLKVVCKLYSEQRAVRVKRVVDRKRISRLEPENKRGRYDSSLLKTNSKQSNDTLTSGNTHTTASTPEEDGPKFDSEDEELSPEEAQMFEEENKQLFDEMSSLVDEVRNIEGKVVEISRLQEIFTEKVLEQEKDIDRIANTVVGTTENIKDANEDIREAMKNNAGFRVWILFFLMMCSFSLLFLDWFNA